MKLETRPPEWIDEAPLLIEVDAIVAASPDAVWAVIADNKSWPDWFPGFTQCSWSDPGGTGSVGVRRQLRQGPFVVHEVMTAWEPGKRWAMSVEEINLGLLRHMAETVDLSSTETGTRVVWRLGAALSGWARPLAPLLKADNKRKLTKAINALEARITAD